MKTILRSLLVIGVIFLFFHESYGQIVLGGLPPDISVECDGTIPPPANVGIVSNNCDDDTPEILFSENTIPGGGSCPVNYTIERTWAASNSCGAEVSYTQTITIDDTTEPFLSAPPDITISCEQSTDPVITGTASAFDACGFATVTFSDEIIPGPCPGSYSIFRLWTAVDACQNQTISPQIIVVEDTSIPILLGVPADLVVTSASEVPNPAQVTATDNCGTPTVSFNETQTGDVITRTWTATDECDNVSSDSQEITIEVPATPVITVPADVFLECGQSTDPLETGVAVSIGGCGVTTITFIDQTLEGSCSGEYTINRTWTATDECSNEDSQIQIIEVQDTTPPGLEGVPEGISVQCSEDVPPPAEVTAIDFCDQGPVIVILEEDINWGENEFEYHLIRSWTATDACGNSVSAQQTIFVEDITAPILNGVPESITVECEAVPELAEVTATDNCDNGVFISFEETRIDGPCANTYTLIRTWTARDGTGNNTTSSQEVNVVDTTPPQIIAMADLTLAGDQNCQAQVPSIAYEVDDNCSSFQGIQVVQDPPEGTILTGPGIFPVTVTAVDECGNSSSTEVLLTVLAPELQVICQDILVQLDASGNATIVPELLDGGSSGGCGALTFSIDRSEFNCSDIGQNEVLLTVTDANQNSVSCTAIVTVEDNIAPVLQCQNITLQLDATGNVSITPQDLLGSGSDACGIASLSIDRTSFNCNNLGANTVTLTSTDVNGNTSSCTAIVTVEDVLAPVAICQEITLELDASGNASITPADIDNGSNDACGLASLSIDNTTFTCGDIGSNTVTLTVTDVNGNVSSCQALVTIVDAIAPIITAPENLTLGNDPEMCAASVILPDLIVEDNCDVATIENDSPDLFQVGSTTVLWTVSDTEGNVSAVEQIITITNDAPVINLLTGPSSPVLEGTEIEIYGTFTDNNLVSATVDWGDGQVSNALIVGNEFSASHIYSVPGTVSIILTVEDACGETADAVIENLEIQSVSFEGFVKGAGFFKSPKGAYKPNPHASGRFLFGFLVKNRDHYDHPKGGTIFFFRAGKMLFASHEYEYLSVTEGKAIYQGTGRVNRSRNYQFQVTAIDGQASSTDEYHSDAIKIKIWNEDGIVYENEITEIYAGHIWIYPYTRKFISARSTVSDTYQEVDETQPTIEELISEYGESNIMAYPNPFDESVRIEYIPLTTGRASAKIYDLQGRIVTTIFDGEVEEFLPLSWEFRPDEYLDKGVYMLRIQDGLLPQTIRLNYHK